MNTLIKIQFWAGLAAALLAAPVHAGEDRVDFDFNAGVGARYDSNVALLDLDASAGEPDAATELSAGLGVTIRPGGDLLAKFGYNFSGTRYREFSEFDLDLHHGYASLTLRKGLTDATIGVDHFSGILDGEDYLTQTQVSPSISRLFGTRWYLRGAYIRADKEYAQLTERNAVSDGVRGDVYLLLNGMRHYIALGAQAKSEHAQSADFDYESTMGQLKWAYTIDTASTEIELQTRVQFERRDYTTATLESGEARIDDRLRYKLAAAMPFSEYVSLSLSVEHTDNTSGLAEANIDRTVYAMELEVGF